MTFKNDNQRKAVMATLNNGASSRQNTSQSTLSQVKNNKKPKVQGIKWKTEEDGRTRTNVTKKIGNWEVGFIKFQDNPRTFLMVRGLEYGENPIIYSHIKRVGYDRPERVPQSVKNYIFKNAGKLFDIHKQENSSVNKREW